MSQRPARVRFKTADKGPTCRQVYRFIGVWQQESGKGPRFADGAAKLRIRINLSYPLPPLESIAGAVRSVRLPSPPNPSAGESGVGGERVVWACLRSTVHHWVCAVRRGGRRAKEGRRDGRAVARRGEGWGLIAPGPLSRRGAGHSQPPPSKKITNLLAFAPCKPPGPPGPPGPPTGPQMVTHIVSDATTATHGAKCLDGTPPAYLLRAGTGANASKFVIFLDGLWQDEARVGA